MRHHDRCDSWLKYKSGYDCPECAARNGEDEVLTAELDKAYNEDFDREVKAAWDDGYSNGVSDTELDEEEAADKWFRKGQQDVLDNLTLYGLKKI